MKEIWEVFKSIKTQSGITINYVISNQAHIKLEAYFNDEKLASYNLELGKGLYCDYNHKNGHTIRIAKCGGDIYRHVYFMQYTGHQYIKGWQIHHIDYNHCNNSIDNLMYCSVEEHGRYHAFQYKLGNEKLGYKQDWSDIELTQLNSYNKALDYYKWLDTNKDLFNINIAINYMNNIRAEIEEIAAPIIKQYKLDKAKQRKLEKEQKKIKKLEQERIDKLNSGNYIEVDGKLKRVMSDWQKQQMAEGRRRNCYNNPEWRKHVSDRNKQYAIDHPERYTSKPSAHKGKIGISKGNIRTYIFESELNNYIELGYKRGFK